MKIQNFTPDFTGNALRITLPRAAKQNASHTYFYNEVSGLIKKHKVPALINNKGVNIEISDTRYQAVTLTNLEKAFKDLNLFFYKTKN